MIDYSMLEAFHALNESEKAEHRAIRKRRIHEGATINVGGSVDTEEVRNKIQDKANDADEVQIMPINDDDVKHIQEGSSYIGEYALRCKVCHALSFIKGEDDKEPLVQDKADTTIYNKDTECPNCHKIGQGFELIGQMQAAKNEQEDSEEDATVEEPDEESAEIENDAAEDEDEADFDNDLDGEAESTNAEEAPEEATDEIDLGGEEEAPEYGTDETDEDDTFGSDSQFGDEIDPNETAPDDTEDYTSFDKLLDDHRKQKAAKEEQLNDSYSEDKGEEDLDPDDERENGKKEILTETDQPRLMECLDDFFDCINNPDHIKKCSYDSDYDGTYEEFPAQLRRRKFGSFDCNGAVLFVTILDNDSECNKLSDMLRYFSGNSDICVQNEDGDQICYGDKDLVNHRCGNRAFKCFDVPSCVKIHSTCPDDVGCRGIYGEGIKHLKSRKELAEALKNNTRPYNISRSKLEGYRYDLNEAEDDYDDEEDWSEDEIEAEVEAGRARELPVHHATRRDEPNRNNIQDQPHDEDEFDYEDLGWDPDEEELEPIEDMEPEDDVDDAGINADQHEQFSEDMMSIETNLARIADDIQTTMWDVYHIQVPKMAAVIDVLSDINFINRGIDPQVLDSEARSFSDRVFEALGEFDSALDHALFNLTQQHLDDLDPNTVHQAAELLNREECSSENIRASVTTDQFIDGVRQGGIFYLPQGTDLRARLENNDLNESIANDTISYITDGEKSIFCCFVDSDEYDQAELEQLELYGEPTMNEVERAIQDAIGPYATFELVDYEDDIPEGFELAELSVRPSRDYNSYDELIPTEDQDPSDFGSSDDFDSDDFDRDINEYFKQNYNKKAIYESRVGTYDEKGTIIVEGKLTGEKERHVRFTLTPNSDGSYRVTNNLSSEVFEYKK